MIENFATAIFISVFTYCVINVWRNRWLYYYGSKLPGPLGLPVIGSLYCTLLIELDVLLDNVVIGLNSYRAPFVKFWIGNHLAIIPKETEHIEIFLKNYLEKPSIYDFAKPVVNGLLTAPVETWKRHKKLINQSMNQNNLNSFVEIFFRHSNKVVDALKENQLDLFPIISKYTINNICEAMIDIESSAIDKQEEYMSQLLKLQDLFRIRLFTPLLHVNLFWKLSSLSKEFDDLVSKTENFINNVIEKKRSQEVKPTKKSFVNDVMYSIEEQWTDKEIIDETQTIIIAGSETTAVTICYVLLTLALHPEIQENVYKEIFKKLGINDPITRQDLNDLDYLDRVIKETMRLFPTVPLFARLLEENIELDSYILPKGSNIVIPIIYFHKHPKFWPDPYKFNPDRFLPEEIAKRPAYCYMPFSGGPRKCIGIKYAMMSIKVVLSSIIRCFKISTPQYKSVFDIKIGYGMTNKPIDGFKIKLEERQANPDRCSRLGNRTLS